MILQSSASADCKLSVFIIYRQYSFNNQEADLPVKFRVTGVLFRKWNQSWFQMCIVCM